MPFEENRSKNYFKANHDWIPKAKTFFIFDEAQATYEDNELWYSFFKEAHRKAQFAIAFASYGSPNLTTPNQSIPFIVREEARVTLCPIDHGDGLGTAGLLFTQQEFDDFKFEKHPSPEYHSHQSFFDGVFDITGGHVGAMEDFIGIVVAHNVRIFTVLGCIT
jgi:hypothetical protein